MRIAIAGVVCALLSVTSFASASPVNGPMQALQPDELRPLKPGEFEAYDLRMAPLERWSVRFTALEDDGKIVCVAVVNGKKVDAVTVGTDNCLLAGVNLTKKPVIVTATVKNTGKEIAHYGSSFE